MKRVFALLALTAVFVTCTWAAEEDRSKELDRVRAASNVLNEIMATPDKGIPQEILAGADCVVVVPSMLKGGFVVGGRYGKGVATCRTQAHGANRWSAPAPIRIEGGSWGLQIGGQAVDLVMLVMNEKGMQHLLSSKFEVGADASAAAGPVGRHAEAGTDWKMRSEFLTYSRSRGAFAGITLNGAVIKQDTDDTLALYGKDASFRNILSGAVPPPEGTQQFLSEVRKYFGEAKAAAHENAEVNEPATHRGTSGGMSATAAPADRQGTQSGTSGSVGANTSSSSATTGTTTETTTSSGMSSAGASSDQVRANIENALRQTPNLSSSNVNVSVDDNQVTLSGSVPNDADKATIRRIVQQNAGGRKIVDDGLVVK